jgi:rhodanese-related sulfurtransferase
MRSILVCVLLVLGFTVSAQAGEYNYISAEEMKGQIEAQSGMIIVDIQVAEEFAQHHLPGSIATYAYPVKTDAERAQIDVAVQEFNASGKPVVIVCPRGAGGAKRCYDYMKEHNVPAEKISILEKGIAGWPFIELLEKS